MENNFNKIQFNDYHNIRFNTIKNKEMRISLMSVFSHLNALNNKQNAYEFTTKDKNKLTVSLQEFLNFYNAATSKRNYRRKQHGLPVQERLTIDKLRTRIKKLIELGLIARISKGNNISIFTFVNSKKEFFALQKSQTFSQTENCTETIENTTVEADEEFPTTINLNNKDIDSNTTNGCPKFDKDAYIAKLRKVDSVEVLASALDRVFKIMKVRSSWIKNTVIEKMFKVYQKVTVKHLDSYICKAVENARLLSRMNYKKYVLGNSNSFKPLNFCDFLQRQYSLEELESLEKKLLGWE